MSPLVAAVILLWILVVLLVFAMAGILRKVRALEQRAAAAPAAAPMRDTSEADAVAMVAPRGDQVLSAVLIVEEGCGVCAEVLPRFTAATTEIGSERVDYIVLSNDTESDYAVPDDVRLIADRQLHAALDPGWFPAILVITDDRVIQAVEPAGSPEAVDALVAKLARRAEARR